jgi:diguanylate cyclase (GGDEF)-like protein
LASAGNLVTTRAAVPETSLANDDHNGCFDSAMPLIHEDKPFGTLHYGVDTSFVAALEHKLRTKLYIIATLWFVIGTAVYFVLVRRLVKPLQAITRASESMAHGNLKTEMPSDLPQDELGKLASSFQFMATSLRKRIESQLSYAHALYAEQARLSALLSILPVGIMFVDPSRIVQFINLECRRLWVLPEGEDFVGQQDTVLITHARSQIELPDVFAQHLDAALMEYGTSPPFDTPLRNGRTIRGRSCVVPDAAGKRYIGRIWIFEDVTEEHVRLLEAQASAERDVLTGLFIRHRFEEDLNRMFAQAQRNDRRLTLLHFDLDDFKIINDTHGHVAGNMVLKAVAQALMLQSRRNESLYHLGGDEFAILIADAEQHQVEALALRVMTTIEQLQFTFAEHEVHIRCSIGIAAYSPEERPDTAMELMQQANIALYQAKHSGKHRWHVYDSARALDLGKDSR